MKCLGRNFDQHCCWINGKVCKYLEENTEPGFRWTCGLRKELGSWGAVLADPRYLALDLPEGINCRDYPDKNNPCKYCEGHLDGDS